MTTSRFPGTTLDMIDIPLDETTFMYDTPGVIQDHQMTHLVSEDELKVVIPKKEIKQRIYQLNEGQTLFFGGLARIDYISGGKRPLICYFSNELNIHNKQECPQIPVKIIVIKKPVESANSNHGFWNICCVMFVLGGEGEENVLLLSNETTGVG